jgi:hypothetical protein
MVPSLADSALIKLVRREGWHGVRHTSLKKIDQHIVQIGNLMLHGYLSHSLLLLFFERLEWSLSQLTQHSLHLTCCTHQFLYISKIPNNA